MSMLTTTELYDRLTFDELSELIREIVFDKDWARRAILRLPETVNLFVKINPDTYLKVTVRYWDEPGVGYTYGVIGAEFYPDEETFRFYQSLHSKEEAFKRLN